MRVKINGNSCKVIQYVYPEMVVREEDNSEKLYTYRTVGDNKGWYDEDGNDVTMEMATSFPGIEFEDSKRAEHNALRDKQFEIPGQGHIKVIDWMGSDSAIVQAARTSYGKGTKKVSEDRGLIRYLMRHWHTTPFEMCELKLLVYVPMDTWRQWIRHRTASVNEYSTRYSEAIDDRSLGGEWRAQSARNKQGSAGLVSDWPVGSKLHCLTSEGLLAVFEHRTEGWTHQDQRVEGPRGSVRQAEVAGFKLMGTDMTPQSFLTEMERVSHIDSTRVYQARLAFDVAREQARKDLPLSTFTLAYWKVDLHNLFNFLRLRMDSHAQQEIRAYADIIGNEIVAKLWPEAWQAFLDYRLNAVQLTAMDIAHLQGKLELSGRELAEHQLKMEKIYGDGSRSTA